MSELLHINWITKKTWQLFFLYMEQMKYIISNNEKCRGNFALCSVDLYKSDVLKVSITRCLVIKPSFSEFYEVITFCRTHMYLLRPFYQD